MKTSAQFHGDTIAESGVISSFIFESVASNSCKLPAGQLFRPDNRHESANVLSSGPGSMQASHFGLPSDYSPDGKQI